MKFKSAKALLDFLNKEYLTLHKKYEEAFWTSYMGDHSVNKNKDIALSKRDAFSSNSNLREEVLRALGSAQGEEKVRLNHWLIYFDRHQSPAKLGKLKERIMSLETQMHKKVTSVNEGYIDPETKKFVKASTQKMSGIMRTNSNEKTRKACFDAMQKLALLNLSNYVKFVKLLNQYAKGLGYEDFYAYKINIAEGMTKNELFKIFDDIYKRTKYAFKDIRYLEKTKPGLRKPWNKSFIMAGDLTKEDDQYFPFEEALTRWGKSFNALGIDFKKGTLTLDLLDREGKHNNGFCHWPSPVNYCQGKRVPGRANFTCNVVYGQPGSSAQGYVTLFHEGGHAAHYLNSEVKDVCMNIEYPPSSVAWAETQSMFLDTIFSSYEWRSRYAKNKKGKIYPLDLYKRKLERLNVLNPLGLMGMISVSRFEKEIFECKKLNENKVLNIARRTAKKYYDFSHPTIGLLNVPHIYSWESSCYYHSYALADIALDQWREHFYKKYGYIVDNPKVGEDMIKVWRMSSTKTFKEFIMLATGKELSSNAWIKNAIRSKSDSLKLAQKRAENLRKISPHKGKVKLNGNIRLVSGKKLITDSTNGFENMAKKYIQWLDKQTK